MLAALTPPTSPPLQAAQHDEVVIAEAQRLPRHERARAHLPTHKQGSGYLFNSSV